VLRNLFGWSWLRCGVRFADAETLLLVTELMVKHKEEEIKGILGANWLRVAERVWR
jgi:microsomal dipeptidase-like Zn-dependent dipeptidase